MYRTAYLLEPKWAKVSQRLALVFRHTSVVLLGLFCLFYGIPGLPLVGWVLLTTGLSAAIGAATGYYRAELVAIGPLVGALLIAGVLVWPFSAGIVEMLIVALAFAQVDRGIHLMVVQNSLRRQHKLEKLSTHN